MLGQRNYAEVLPYQIVFAPIWLASLFRCVFLPTEWVLQNIESLCQSAGNIGCGQA
jgi:hypothetical protein